MQLPAGAPAFALARRAVGASAGASWRPTAAAPAAVAAAAVAPAPGEDAAASAGRLALSWAAAAAAPVAAVGAASARRRGARLARRAAKKKKNKGGGQQEKVAPISEGSAYSQETRDMILELEGVTKTGDGGQKILNNVYLGMYLGAKIGILGQNGAGKSTVMRILAGEDTEFQGKLHMDEDINIGYLEQEPKLEEETVVEALEPAVQKTRDMVAEFEEVSVKMCDPDEDMDALMARMDVLQSKIDACNGWEIDKTLDKAMEALRCPPRDAKIANLSGGEKRRVAICRLLLSNPDILLLDEPTNHLDAQSVAWLERFLADFKGTVVAVTHDRYFLDNVAGWILELDQGEGIPFEGNYSGWLQSKAKRLQDAKKKQATLQKQIDEELQYLNKRRSGQQKKGKARMRKYDDLLEQQSKFTRASELDSIVITPGPPLRGDVVTVKGLCKGYGDRMLIGDADFTIPPGAVVGIIGPNGAGKTTLFNMIMEREAPDQGDIILGQGVVPMYVDQSRDDLNGENTVFEELSGGCDFIPLGDREVSSRAYCAWFNFKGNAQSRQVQVLSGGERNRLQLAKTLRNGGNVLMLDEPSNDLDVTTLRALEQAIENFAGTVLCISHDRWFLDRIATHILAYEGDSNLVFFPGSYSEYEEDRIERTGVVDPTAIKYKPMPTLA